MVEIPFEMLPDFAARFVRDLPREAGAEAYVVGLRGELGAGKTTFVQAVAKALGVSRIVTSPTFVIARTYSISRPPFARLVHIDAYRLGPSEPDTIGWHAVAENPKNLVLIEWPERLSRFPAQAPVLRFEVSGPNTRSIAYEKEG